MWSETYNSLTAYQQGEFRRLCHYLLSHTYIVRKIYRADKQCVETNPNYRTVVSMFQCIREYFAFSGWRLEKDDDYGVISLVSEIEKNNFSADRITTLFLYTCRLFYEEERGSSGTLNIAATDTETVLQKMRLLNIVDAGKPSKTELINAQRTLARFNIIQKTKTGAWSTDGNDFIILPSIISIISNQQLSDMLHELEELKITEAESDDS